ncbi:MAG: electron transport complex subunit RsxB [Ideonella sp.]|nr:electron transport complex subunit RsxB [Ideonella sp.]
MTRSVRVTTASSPAGAGARWSTPRSKRSSPASTSPRTSGTCLRWPPSARRGRRWQSPRRGPRARARSSPAQRSGPRPTPRPRSASAASAWRARPDRPAPGRVNRQRSPAAQALVHQIDAALPQTQCTRCGEPDCRRYAEAIAEGRLAINRCPPGGAQGVVRLAGLTGQPIAPLDAGCGVEGPLKLAVIDEAWCIGCTLCIKACPVDCIIGASKRMHTVIDDQCTGCELCLPVCPVDCIEMVPVSVERTGWAAWSPAQADASKERYEFHQWRTAREQLEHDDRLAAKAMAKLADLPHLTKGGDDAEMARKRAVIEAALQRARARRA